METLNNYISERLNPRNLGPSRIIELNSKNGFFIGTVDWNLDTPLLNKFKKLKWMAGTVCDVISGDHILVIWDKTQSYLLTLSLCNARNWLGRIAWNMYLVNKSLIKNNDLYHTLQTGYKTMTIRSLKKDMVEMPDNGSPEIINNIIAEFIETFKNCEY